MERFKEHDTKETYRVFNRAISEDLEQEEDGYYYIPLDIKWFDVGFVGLFLELLLKEENNLTKDHTYIGFYSPILSREGAQTQKKQVERRVSCRDRRRYIDPIITSHGKRVHIYHGESKQIKGSISPTLLFVKDCFYKEDGEWKPHALSMVQQLTSTGKTKVIILDQP